MIEHTEGSCRSGSCGWGFKNAYGLGCKNGDSCAEAYFLECEESDFHDANLVKATTAIKAVLSLIPPDPNGRNLALVQTKLGVVLAWVTHSEEENEFSVTYESENEDVIEALKIIVDSTNQQCS